MYSAATFLRQRKLSWSSNNLFDISGIWIFRGQQVEGIRPSASNNEILLNVTVLSSKSLPAFLPLAPQIPNQTENGLRCLHVKYRVREKLFVFGCTVLMRRPEDRVFHCLAMEKWTRVGSDNEWSGVATSSARTACSAARPVVRLLQPEPPCRPWPCLLRRRSRKKSPHGRQLNKTGDTGRSSGTPDPSPSPSGPNLSNPQVLHDQWRLRT